MVLPFAYLGVLEQEEGIPSTWCSYHVLLWIKDAPVIGQDDLDVVLE